LLLSSTAAQVEQDAEVNTATTHGAEASGKSARSSWLGTFLVT
jgi:hypothetical protein